ncbi:MAG: MarR family transcriptional regulator [Alphaproteobacteria bacterium]
MAEKEITTLADALLTIYRRLDLLHDEQGQVTPKELELMTVLDENGPTRVKDLAEKVKLPLSTVSWTADKMVGRRLLARKSEPGDRRVILLTLTRSGRSVLQSHYAIFTRLARLALASLTPEEQVVVVKAINDVINKI